MLFDVEEDSGSRVVGYLVPDSFTASSRIQILNDGVALLDLDANTIRPSVIAAGRHNNGMCGFVLSEDNVPGIAELYNLEIRDAASQFPIYHRFREGIHVPVKLLRLETCHIRSSYLDQQLSKHFQLAHIMADRFGRETVTQTLMMKGTTSCYVSARFPYREFEFSIDDSFRRLCILKDPYTELAQTILALSEKNSDREPSLGLREQLSLGDCLEFFSYFNFRNKTELQNAFARLPPAIETELANQLARLLAARTSDETPRSTYVASALESLSTVDVVGIYERPITYLKSLEELLGATISAEPLEATESILNLAQELRSISSIQTLLDMDMQVYETVRAALAAHF